jgi:hypothetical protein
LCGRECARIADAYSRDETTSACRVYLKVAVAVLFWIAAKEHVVGTVGRVVATQFVPRTLPPQVINVDAGDTVDAEAVSVTEVPLR